MSRPITREERHDPSIHGVSGLDGSPSLDKFASLIAEKTFATIKLEVPVGKRLDQVMERIKGSVLL